LLQQSKSGLVCFTGEAFLGALAYADDTVLLVPTHTAMWNMLAVCDNLAREHHVVFNAKKSKCLYFNSYPTRSRISTTVPQFSLAGNDIEFVDEWPHLGHIITKVHDTRMLLLASEILYVVRSITYCASLVNVSQLLNCHSLEHIAAVFLWQCHIALIALVH